MTTYSVEDYRGRISARSEDEQAKFLIYSIDRHGIIKDRRRVGGLADRLKGIYSAFLMAVATDRVFLIDWETPFALADNLKPRRYDWRLDPYTKLLNRKPRLLHLDMIDKRGDVLRETAPGDLEQDIFGGCDTCVLNINWLTDAKYLASYDLPHTTEVAFQTIFDFLFDPQTARDFRAETKKLDKIKKAHDGLFGVHLRTGGDAAWEDPKLDKRRSYRSLMKAAFDFAADRGSRDPLFYFASDSESAKRAVAKRSWPHQVTTIPGPIQHLDRSTDMTRQGNDFAFFEFDLLRRCDGVIGGAGAFYSTAAMAGGKPYTTYRD